ncbi:hypothetical protein [Yoonia tamlensis]|uniref:hypothetical protein n=1 Tax=Yoonia tamlensis TaxID=390270 RepID=UPI001041FCE3|nr:hypothetical protein [Yoonia tamlensis]
MLVLDAPDNYRALLAGAEAVQFQSGICAPDQPPVAAAHVFIRDEDMIAPQARLCISHLQPGGMLWFSWAKKSSKLHSGVTEDDLRTHVLPLGWVDVKVCAIDPDWSGLKFMKRKVKPT